MTVGFSRILVPVDGSDGALRAVRFAAALARATGAELTLLHVHPTISAEVIGMTARDDTEMDDTRAAIAEMAFAGVEDALGREPRPYETLVTFGDPAPEIIGHAHAHSFDLIVVGSRGRSPLKELLLGSVSSKLVHYAPCAVTVVR